MRRTLALSGSTSFGARVWASEEGMELMSCLCVEVARMWQEVVILCLSLACSVGGERVGERLATERGRQIGGHVSYKAHAALPADRVPPLMRNVQIGPLSLRNHLRLFRTQPLSCRRTSSNLQ
jgi:hypothetical protein